MEAKQGIGLATVEPIDRIVQPGSRVDVTLDRQWVVNALGPVVFLERPEDHFLILCRNPESLDHQAVDAQLAQVEIPSRLECESGGVLEFVARRPMVED